MGILGGVGSIIGGIAGRGAVKKGNAAYNDALAKLKQAYEDQTILNPDDYVVDYEQMDPELLKYYAPILEQAEQMGDTQLGGVSLDPAYQDAQREALSSLQQRANEGLTIGEEAARNDIMRNLNATNRGNQEAVLQQMARRGQMGGGAEIAARLAAQQGDFSEAARQAEALATQRDQRALQAALEGGNLATSLRTQDYGEQADLAKARDAIAQFNTNQRASVQTRNVGNQNLAAKNEADLRNQTYGANLDLKNQQATQRTHGLQQSTNAKNQKGIDIGNAGLGIGQAKQAQGVESAKYRGGMGKAIGGLADQAARAVMTMGASEAIPNNDSTFDMYAGPDQKDSGGGGGGGITSMFSGLLGGGGSMMG